MDTRILGRTGRAVSAIGLGTWQLGADWGDVSEEQALDVLGEMRKVIPADSMQEIEREIFSDQFGFLTHKSKLARAQAIDDLRRALDWAALVLFAGREVTINDMLDRWEEVRRDKLRHAVEWARRLNNGIPAE